MDLILKSVKAPPQDVPRNISAITNTWLPYISECLFDIPFKGDGTNQVGYTTFIETGQICNNDSSEECKMKSANHYFNYVPSGYRACYDNNNKIHKYPYESRGLFQGIFEDINNASTMDYSDMNNEIACMKIKPGLGTNIYNKNLYAKSEQEARDIKGWYVKADGLCVKKSPFETYYKGEDKEIQFPITTKCQEKENFTQNKNNYNCILYILIIIILNILFFLFIYIIILNLQPYSRYIKSLYTINNV